MKIRAKRGAKIFGTQPEMIWCDMVVASVFAEFGKDCIITSGIEGGHGNHSHHYKGFARDYRTHNVPQGWHERLAQRIRECLTDEFQVVLEKTHLHCEFDPERGVNA